MTHFIVSRAFHTILALFVIITIVFVLVRITGDPVSLLLPTTATDEQIERVRERLGLDRPFITQYVMYLRGVLTRGDFGLSYRLKTGALQAVMSRAGATAQLALGALTVALLIGIPAGITSGLRPGTMWDLGVQVTAIVGQSVPTFWLGIVLMLLFSVRLQWFPIAGEPGLSTLVLPAITLGMPTGALIARMLRSTFLEIRSQDYVRTARAKGLHEGTITVRHILRNAAVPVLTVLALQMGLLMGGAVVTETVFNYPGMGLLAVQSIYGRDYSVVQAFVFMVALFVMSLNLLVDIAYVIVDPRVRYS